MWSSKLQFSSNSSAQNKVNPPHSSWSHGAPPASPHPIPVLEDGTLELDLARHTQFERVASVPLQYNALSYSREGPQNNTDTAKHDPVRVYINQQGHTVKLAQLPDPPASYPLRGMYCSLFLC